ncbi:MAG: hypothetical protein ABI597_12900 [Gammaproteobacteria bacterium]
MWQSNAPKLEVKESEPVSPKLESFKLLFYKDELRRIQLNFNSENAIQSITKDLRSWEKAGCILDFDDTSPASIGMLPVYGYHIRAPFHKCSFFIDIEKETEGASAPTKETFEDSSYSIHVVEPLKFKQVDVMLTMLKDRGFITEANKQLILHSLNQQELERLIQAPKHTIRKA